MNGNAGNLIASSRPGEKQDEDELTLEALRISNMVAFPMVLKSAIEIGLVEVLYNGGKGGFFSVPDIIDKLPVKPKSVQAPDFIDRLLRSLTIHSILTCRGVDKGEATEIFYSAKPICKFFVDNQECGSFAPWHLLLHDQVHLDSWCNLTNMIMEGGGTAFEKTKGMSLYEYTEKDGRFNDLFNDAMTKHSTFVLSKLGQVYKGFNSVNVLVDVGGGSGTTASIIAKAFPNLRAISFDLPHIIESASRYPGVEYVAGDMFESIPKADAIFMKWILHTWSDEHCLKILENCCRALPENGKVIIMEDVVETVPITDKFSEVATDLDGVLMMVCKGGKHRRLKEFESFAARTGFRGCRIACSIYNYEILEIYK